MAAAKKGNLKGFSFGPWNLSTRSSPIAKSDEADNIASELDLPALPEMLFTSNSLSVIHKDGFGISFNAVDALRLVDNKNDSLKVAVADEWRRQRADNTHIGNVHRPFDWTYTTDYCGTLVSKLKEKSFKTSETAERINMDKLKVKEKIQFYDNVLLFEDELADHGMAILNVKIRVMTCSFFILLRFFLRVDDVLIRVNDTRLYYEAGCNYILREFTSKEKAMDQLKNPKADINVINEELELKKSIVDKLLFPDGSDFSKELFIPQTTFETKMPGK